MTTDQIDFINFFENLDGNSRKEFNSKMPVVNADGHRLSDVNTAYLAWQSDRKFTSVASYQDWIQKGRCVKKGQHGYLILVPWFVERMMSGNLHEVINEDSRIISRWVFDISQTIELKEQPQKQEAVAEEAF